MNYIHKTIDELSNSEGAIHRGKILILFADIELKIKIFISKNYSFTNKGEEQFTNEILNNPHLHFSTLKNIFEIILKRTSQPLLNEYEKNISGKLYKLYNYRNVSAHSSELINQEGKSTVSWGRPGYPKDQTTESVYQEFYNLFVEVFPFFEKISTNENK